MSLLMLLFTVINIVKDVERNVERIQNYMSRNPYDYNEDDVPFEKPLSLIQKLRKRHEPLRFIKCSFSLMKLILVSQC